MKYCPQCHNACADSSTYCATCGCKLSIPDKKKRRKTFFIIFAASLVAAVCFAFTGKLLLKLGYSSSEKYAAAQIGSFSEQVMRDPSGFQLHDNIILVYLDEIDNPLVCFRYNGVNAMGGYSDITSVTIVVEDDNVTTTFLYDTRIYENILNVDGMTPSEIAATGVDLPSYRWKIISGEKVAHLVGCKYYDGGLT